jgi:hypothetical protein
MWRELVRQILSPVVVSEVVVGRGEGLESPPVVHARTITTHINVWPVGVDEGAVSEKA